MASDTMKTINDVPLILRREIEARMVEPFIRAFAKELGEEKTIEIVKSVVAGLAEEAGEGLAKTLGDNSLDSFVKNIMPIFSTGGGLQYEVKEVTDDMARIDIVHCAYADMYKRLGMTDLGPILSCGRDESLIKGFNPDVEFIRKYTIMEGESYCDFCLKKL